MASAIASCGLAAYDATAIISAPVASSTLTPTVVDASRDIAPATAVAEKTALEVSVRNGS